jgi:hypothetical protein
MEHFMAQNFRVVEYRRNIVQLEAKCWQQAVFNLEHAYKDQNLKLVLGSLGIGKRDPWFEFGGENWDRVAQFKKQSGDLFGRRQWDVHVWLENEDGKIFDVISQHVVQVARIRRKKVDCVAGQVIDGVSREVMADKGLTYVDAPEVVQRVILAALDKDWRSEVDMWVVPWAFGRPPMLSELLAMLARNAS